MKKDFEKLIVELCEKGKLDDYYETEIKTNPFMSDLAGLIINHKFTCKKCKPINVKG